MTTATQKLNVTGMSCGHCVKAVEKHLLSVPGVQSVSVDLAAGKATVVADQAVSKASLAAAVEDAGYGVGEDDGESDDDEPDPGPQAEPELDRLALKVEGMTCAACVRTIERRLEKVDGVADGETRARLVGLLQLAQAESVTGVI